MSSKNSIILFPYSEKFNDQHISELDQKFKAFLSTWNAHGSSLFAEMWIEENQIIVVKIDESKSEASGCSKDKLFKFISEINSELKLVEGSLSKFYVKKAETIQILSRIEIQKEIENGRLDYESQLLPIWITKWEEYQQLWKKPIGSFSTILRLKFLV